MERTFQRILVIRDDRIGDVILTLPMAQVLRKRFPAARIAMLIQRYTAEIVEDHPCVDDLVYCDDSERPVSLLRLVAEVRARNFDLVFHTHPSLRLALMTWLAGIPVRVGTGYRWYSFLFNRKVWEHRSDARFHELEYNLHLLNVVGCEVGEAKVYPTLSMSPGAAERGRALLQEFGIGPNDLLAVLHPGSGRSARDWSGANFGTLGRRLVALPDVKVLVVGGRGEERLVAEVQSSIGPGAVASIDRLTLREYAAVLRQAAVFVANSTGPIHIAAAVGTPVVGLYPQLTALSARRWGPYTERKTVFSPVDKPEDCRVCLFEKGEPCACMASIGVDAVFDAAARYLRERSLVKA